MIREIPGFSGQFVTDDGRVFSSRNGEMKEKPQRLDTKGYLRVNLRDNSHPAKTKPINVHTIVLLAFVGQRPKGMECRHLNGNCLDNSLKNLKWGTHQENMEDQIRHGTSACLRKGEKHSGAKLTNHQVENIRKMFEKGVSRAEIAKAYSISWRHACDIILWRTRVDG